MFFSVVDTSTALLKSQRRYMRNEIRISLKLPFLVFFNDCYFLNLQLINALCGNFDMRHLIHVCNYEV